MIAAFAFLIVLVQDWGTSHCDFRVMAQVQCINNLKMLGLAIASYESAHRVLPIGTIPSSDLSLECRLGWNYLIAPELQIRGTFADGELSQLTDDPNHAPLRSKPPSVVSCPADRVPTNAAYIGIAGLGIDAPGLPKTDPRAGIFGENRAITLADIRDGLAQSMMVVESSRKSGPWFAGGRATVRGLDPSNPPYIGPGAQFGGIHPQGSFVLMADGSVKVVQKSVAPKIFEALSTIAGGEKVSAPWDD